MINKGKMSKVVYPRGRQGQDRMDKWKVEREQSINKINWNLKQPEQHKVFYSSWLTVSESLKSYSLLLASLFKHSMETEEWQLMVKMCQLWTITVINSSLSVLRASLVAQRVKNPPTMRETWVRSLGWEDPLEGYPLQYPGLENSMDCIVRGVAESDTTEWLSLDFTLVSPIWHQRQYTAGLSLLSMRLDAVLLLWKTSTGRCLTFPTIHTSPENGKNARSLPHHDGGGREEPGKMVFQHLSALVLGNTLLFWFSLEKPLLLVGWGERWEEDSGGRGYGSTCGWFLLMYDRKPHNSVKQLSFS